MLLSELRLSVEKLHDAAAANAYRNTARCLEQNAQQLTEVNDA